VREQKLKTYDDEDGYAVLSILLDEHGASTVAGAIVSPTTSSGGQLPCYKVPEEFQVALSDFHRQNREPLRLADRLRTKIKYDLADDPPKEMPDPAPGDLQVENLPLLRTRISVSAVGFDKSRTHAVAYITMLCGSECLSAGYYLLKRERSGWREVKGNPLCEVIAQGSHREGTDLS